MANRLGSASIQKSFDLFFIAAPALLKELTGKLSKNLLRASRVGDGKVFINYGVKLRWSLLEVLALINAACVKRLRAIFEPLGREIDYRMKLIPMRLSGRWKNGLLHNVCRVAPKLSYE